MNFKDKKNPPKVLYNSKWLSKLSFEEVLTLASQFTVQQMIERDMFQKRLQENMPIHLHEFLYPLMQGYDSVAMDVDVELCGTDQTFNALAGRTLMRRLKNKEKFVVVVNLMENPKTHELMSKSRGTGVFLSAPPAEMYGAVMAQPDEMTEVLFLNVTDVPLSEKKGVMALGPRDAKARVAFEIVRKIYGEQKAKAAEAEFGHRFREGGTQVEGEDLVVNKKKISALDLVLASKVLGSKGEARRLIEQGGLDVGGRPIKDPSVLLDVNSGDTLRVGKKHFFKLKVR
jgi:tyrosyl-tRNA synthetase